MALKILGYCQEFRFKFAVSLFLFCFAYLLNLIPFVSFSSASVCLSITDEQEAFIRRVLDIPFDEKRCKNLIMLDTLHAYCSGPVLTPKAHRLN